MEGVFEDDDLRSMGSGLYMLAAPHGVHVFLLNVAVVALPLLQ